MENKKLMRLQLDKEFENIRNIKYSRPNSGWIKVLREALAMSTRQLAKRLHCSQSRIVQMEQNEIHETLSLHALRQAAHALECELVYFLIPKKSLDDIMRDHACTIAKKRLKFTAHSMGLEAQTVDTQTQQLQLELEIEALLQKPSKLWNE
jgi:predicted DNA-binding mobile mystery protein A